MTKREANLNKITDSSGNAFADLGLEDGGALLAKAQLASLINRVIKRRGLTQAEAGKILGVSQAEVSRLSRGELDRFSTEKLMQLMMKCDRDVEIVVKRRPASRPNSKLSVRAA
jgi:predicted XRE-type DNA-binding protein